MKLTKFDMAKVISTALYNLPELVTENNKQAWRYALKVSRMKKRYVESEYKKAVVILQRRVAEVI